MQKKNGHFSYVGKLGVYGGVNEMINIIIYNGVISIHLVINLVINSE